MELRHSLLEDTHRLATHLFQADAKAFQNASGNSLTLTQQPKKEMFGANIIMAQATRLIHRKLNDPLRSRGKPDFALNGSLPAPYDKLNSTAHLVQFRAQV
jgi:hypothetical protein